MASTATLTSLAMLKVNKDLKDSDYVDYLRPFVLDVLSRHKPDPIHDRDIADYLKGDFGLQIPNRGVQIVLNRLRKQGYLEKRDSLFRLGQALPQTGLRDRQSDAAHRIDVLLNNIVIFANKESHASWDTDTAAEVVKSYLSEFGVDCLRTFVLRTALPDVTRRTAKELRIVHSFVRHVYRTSVEQFESFVVLVKGHMLANALLCPDIQSLQKKFERLTIFLDTGLLLRALGLAPDAQTLAATELLDLLRSLRARLAVFDHTVRELTGVLKSAESAFNTIGPSPPIVGEMRRKGMSASDLTLCRSQLEQRLRGLHIHQRPAPKHVHEYQIDESVLGDVLDGEVGYYNPRARLHDIECIRSIFTYRKDSRPVRLEDAMAVFVTTNGPLAKAAFEFGKQFEHSREVSSVITDFSLANIAWLKAPLGAPTLPEREVLAACYAALEPGPELWQKYLTEVDKLRSNGQLSEHDHVFLREDLVAREELVHLTSGEVEGLTRETVPEILDRAKASIVSEERAKNDSLATENRRLREQHELTIARLYWLANSVGLVAAWGLAVVCVAAAFVASGLIPVPWDFINGGLRFVATGALGVGVVLGLVDLVLGFSIKDLFERAKSRASTVTFRILLRLFGLQDGTSES